MVGNELGSRVNSFRVTTRSWQRLASQYVLIKANDSAKFSAPGLTKWQVWVFVKLCLNAQHCHEKALVRTFALLLLMSSWG